MNFCLLKHKLTRAFHDSNLDSLRADALSLVHSSLPSLCTAAHVAFYLLRPGFLICFRTVDLL